MKKVLLVFAFVLQSAAYGYGIGYSTHPLLPSKKLLSTELTGIVSNGGGVGIQARYTQNLSKEAVFDAGLGIGGGERSSRIFAGLDYEIFPDYAQQPRVSLKGTLENAKEFDTRMNILSLAPTVSKGFSFWGREAYPFVALPFAVGLNDDTKTYETMVNLTLGATGKVPLRGYQHLTANFEATVDIKDSWTGFFMGVSYPIN